MTKSPLIKIKVDGREIEAEQGTSLLQACLVNDIYIPNFCHIKDDKRPASSCRLCFVELNGGRSPVTACTVRVEEGMIVSTDTPEVRRLQCTAFRLLLSVHHVQCKTCPANRQCELQKIAKFLKIGLKPGPWQTHLKKQEVDRSHPLLDYYPNRCVLCGRCVEINRRKKGNIFLTFADRGFDTVISFFGQRGKSDMALEDLKPLVDICPVKAIVFKDE